MKIFHKPMVSCLFVFVFVLVGVFVYGASLEVEGFKELTIKIKDAPASDFQKSILKANVSLFASRAKAWDKFSMKLENVVWSNVRVKLHLEEKDPEIAIKKAAIESALAEVKKRGMKFPGDSIEVFCHSQNQACLGYILPMPGTVKAVFILGTGVTKTTTELVSTKIFEANSSASVSVAMALKARTAVLHEFGHVFHQIDSPNFYYALGEVKMMGGKAPSELDRELKDRYAIFPEKPTVDTMKKLVAEISRIARPVSSYAAGHPNEFIAETFAGLMMGQTYDRSIMTAYAKLGGPVVR